MSRVLVLGMGKSGQWAARLALGQGHSVLAYDDHDISASLSDDLRDRVDLMPPGAARSLDGVGEMVLSPGVPPDHPVVLQAEAAGIPVISEIEFASRSCSGRIFAITGSNGKTTTTALTAHVLQAGSRNAVPCGNYGVPFAEAVTKGGPETDYVLELSSFQLERITDFHPGFASLLNLTPDHLDRYPDPDAYYDAKLNLFANMNRQDVIVLNGDDPEIRCRRERLPDWSRTVGRDGDLVQVHPDELILDGRRLVHLDELHLMGIHNLYNAAFAAGMAVLAGTAFEDVREGLLTFVPIAHRLEMVGERNGVRFYNDSKATNFDSVVKALSSFTSIRWIAGGKFKGGDFSELLDAGRDRVRSAYFIGSSAGKFYDAISGDWPSTVSSTLDQALLDAVRDAQPGDVVLLAPGCASYDQFTNYEERGDAFRKLVEQLP